MLKFILPTEQNRDDVLSFYDEIEKSGGECIGIGNYKNYDLWLTGMQNRHTGKDLPEGYVRENFYLCYEGARLIGVFSLKFELTEFLLNYGGHIGYATRLSDRNRGLATQMLKQGLELSKKFGFDRILCICNNDNYASQKVILKNGGVFENELYDPNEEVTVKRFWIQL
jgi:predicted acetyltransferase